MSKVDFVFLSCWILTTLINVCSVQAQSMCGPNQWQCLDKSCIFLIGRCDNFPDCPDASDEKGCAVAQCNECQWSCASGDCILARQFCDGRVDCPDASDELAIDCIDLKPNTSAARSSNRQTSSELNTVQPALLEPWESEMADGEVTSTAYPMPAATQVIGLHTWFPPETTTKNGSIIREIIHSMEVLKPRTAAPKQPMPSPVYPLITQKQTIAAPKQPTPSPVFPLLTQKQTTAAPKQPTPSPVYPSITQKQITAAPKQPVPFPVYPLITQKQTTAAPKQPVPFPVYPLITQKQTAAPKQPIQYPEFQIPSRQLTTAASKELLSYPEQPLIPPKQAIATTQQPTPSPVYPSITQKQTTAAPEQPIQYPEFPIPSRQLTTTASKELFPYPEQPIIPPKQAIATTQQPIEPQTEIIARHTWFPPAIVTTGAPPIRVTMPSVEVALQTTRQSILQSKQLTPTPKQPTIPIKDTRLWTEQPEITTTPLKQQTVTLQQFKATPRQPVTPSEQPIKLPKQPTNEQFWIPPVKRTTTLEPSVMAIVPTESYVSNPFGLERSTIRNPCVEVDDPYEFCRRRYRGYYRHPEDCKQYVVCEWGFLHVCACPDMTQWDQKTLTCTWPKLSECVTGNYDKPVIPNNHKDNSNLHPPSITILNTLKPLPNRFTTVLESTTRTTTDVVRPVVGHRTLPATPSWLKELSEKRYLTPKEPEPLPYQGLLTRFFKPENNTSQIAGQPNKQN